MRIIVTGATGLVGAEVIRQALLDEDITAITALSRGPIDFNAPKLKTIIHKDFLNYDNLDSIFNEHDVCIWCLGISQSQVTKKEYHTITYDYALAAAQAMLKVNPNITFLFVSGGGADSREKSKTLFARVKGKTENALQELPFKKLFIARPGGIKPIHRNPKTSLINKLMIPVFPVVELLKPSVVISSVELAKALLYIAEHGTHKLISENIDLKKAALKANQIVSIF